MRSTLILSLTLMTAVLCATSTEALAKARKNSNSDEDALRRISKSLGTSTAKNTCDKKDAAPAVGEKKSWFSFGRAPASKPANSSWGACYNGIEQGPGSVKTVNYMTGKKVSGSAKGILYSAPYIPHRGAINTSMITNFKDRNKAMKRTPVETLGDITSFHGKKFISGKISSFGGRGDRGVNRRERAAGGGDLLRNANTHGDSYCAMRFDYMGMPQRYWDAQKLLVVNPRTGLATVCKRFDWGPNSGTGRIIDASQKVLKDIGVTTDDTVIVSFAPANAKTGPVQINSCR